MCKNVNIEWWSPEARFFGEFYQKGDFSTGGYNSTLFLSNEERTEREINFILKYLSPAPHFQICDCPCGYGRHSIALAQLGFNITGVDINPYFISQCSEKARQLKVSEKCQFILGNMLDPLGGANSYDIVLNMFTSFGFLETDEANEQVLRNFYNALKPEGRLMLHFDYNATRIINKKYFKGDENKQRKCVFAGRHYDLYVHESYDKVTKRLIGSWQLRNGSPPDPIKKHYSIRIYSNEEIEQLLFKIGFKQVEFLDPNRPEFNGIESKETIIITTK